MSSFKDVYTNNLTSYLNTNIKNFDKDINLKERIFLSSIYTVNLQSRIDGQAANFYSKGKFNIIGNLGYDTAILNEDGGLEILYDSKIICIGDGLFADGVSDGDLMHICVGEIEDNGQPNMSWHGQNTVRGPWCTASVTPNLRVISKGTVFYPWVKCEQGYSANYLSSNSTFTFFIIL